MAEINQQRFSSVVLTGGAVAGTSIVHACNDPLIHQQGPPERFWNPALPSGDIFNVLPSGLGV